MTSASSGEPVSFWAGRPALLRCSCSSSRPVCSESSRDSALNQALILLRARVVLTSASQSRARAALALGGHDLDDVARLQLVVQRHDLAVHARADAAVADVGVDLVGEVQRGRARGQRLDLALGREDEDLVLDQLAAQLVGELRRVVRVGLPVQQALEPLQARGRLVDGGAAAARALLVAPVRGDAVLGGVVHLAGADLDLQRPPLGPDHRGVQRLVHVELRHRHHVLEAAREGLPEGMDDADGAVAVLHAVDDHAHRRQVVDLVELAALAGHLRVDRVEVLGAA